MPQKGKERTSPLFTTPLVFTYAATLRIILFFYGLYQDAISPLKYTDIDYFVFTDASSFLAHGHSPYDRATYRYTPLLAWLLLPTASSTSHVLIFSFGKALFAAADILAGALILRVLRKQHPAMSESRALKYASIWLLNPMVATISTRGSSEGLLGVLVIALLWAVLERRVVLAGALLGLSVHFKIYPFIYGGSVLWFLATDQPQSPAAAGWRLWNPLRGLINRDTVLVTSTALAIFTLLNATMYALYGGDFLQHTFFHHLTRVDHRHNFSPYNTLLYLSSSASARGLVSGGGAGGSFESLAFIPQLVLSAIVLPLVLARKDLAGCMLAQTFAFVAWNKVCTSQYFLWYIIFLPLYLPYSSFTRRPKLGLSAALLWVVAQALWLHQGFRLEFLGLSSFVPGLFVASLLFFAVNVWILGVVVTDVGAYAGEDGGVVA
ncbi:hypothetical protein AJ80_09756 [Polytolypa hystricis UAMH7299]|uniref:GPI mannosyltransferase 1 n=1 Tax=Polytolypa hystricis (strain UAMH7299) TaxID=1447883 RepID=A0A2B7WBU8_POLH7|nr:hypothetical protein AJ80_09756 [Polytolypa hystricis UAMH7299]